MIVKSYKARNTTEALQMVRNDMGPSALIIQTRKLKQGGMMGRLGSTGVEVIAAVDGEPTETAPQAPAETQQNSTFKKLHDALLAQGVIPGLARNLLEEAICRFPSSPFSQSFPNFADKLYASAGGEEEIRKAMTDAVSQTIRFEKSRKPKNGPKVIAMVGPTGVGKTTTIAKLATIAAMRHKLPTGLVTIDTYRIGAVDQLKTYAEMLGTPLEVVQKPDHMPAALQKLSNKAVVFVDTIGRSPNDKERMNALRPFFEHMRSAETHLMVSASAKYEDAMLTARSFSALPLKRLAFSKIDESATYGSIYNVAAQTQLPLSYITTGQEVPEDIEVTTPGRMAGLLMD